VAKIVFDVTIESRLPSVDPVRGFVVINPWPRTQEAEEDVTGRPDDNSGVPMPHDQIAGLGMHNALKAFDPIVEIVGVYVHIGEACSFINRVN